MMLYTPERMLESLKDELDVRNEGYWSNNILMTRLHEAQQEWVRTISEQDPSFFFTNYDISLVAGQALYSLPLNARLGTRWVAAENRLSGTPYYYVYDVDIRRYLTVETMTWPWDDEGTPHIAFQGAQIRVTPEPNNSYSDGIRLGYIPAHGNMVQGALTATPTATAFRLFEGDPDYVTSFGRVDGRDDYYNGMTVLVVSGTGAGQYRTISDYAGSDRTITVSAAWTTTPTTDSTVAVMSPVPEDLNHAVVVRAGILASVKGSRQGQHLERVYWGGPGRPGIYHEATQWVTQRQDFRPQHVQPWGLPY